MRHSADPLVNLPYTRQALHLLDRIPGLSLQHPRLAVPAREAWSLFSKYYAIPWIEAA